ncbi:lactate utilization protein [Caldanaerobius polysaccharolyticus]|uniref:lactate utilization protein n=1 Tax=Caldanaerobius polysaccharolyticus TaxID=44256 RepID=UPI0006910B92|nr:lactate utilization protein [Caldanaerobius polysaccharolyticus]
MNDFRLWYYEFMASNAIKSLEKNNIKGYYVKDIDSARKKVLDLIPEGSTIGLGGSMTLNELDLIGEFRSSKYKLYDRYREGASSQEIEEAKRNSLLADVFVTGTNAITLDGHLVNLDGNGNRVAAMIYGPKKVIVVAGINKVVKDVEEGIKRCREVAAVMNARRFNCSPEDISNCTVIIGKQPENRMHVIIIGDVLGF